MLCIVIDLMFVECLFLPPLQLNMFLQSSHVCDQKTNVLLCPIEMVNFMLLACTKLQQAIIMIFKQNHEQKYTLDKLLSDSDKKRHFVSSDVCENIYVCH